MKKYQKRVIKELKKLEKKSSKIQAFINSDNCPLVEGSQEQELLVSQLHSMWVYASILKRRIQGFEEAVGPETKEPTAKELEESDLFKNIGVVKVEDGDIKGALDEVFNIIKDRIKEDADVKK